MPDENISENNSSENHGKVVLRDGVTGGSFGNWVPKVPLKEMMSMLRSEGGSLADVILDMDEQAGETTQTKRPIDFRRLEIMNRLLELLTEQSPSRLGILQSTVVGMFTNTYLTQLPAYFFTPDEIDNGCAELPGCPLHVAIEIGVDDRLVVTIETFEDMVDEIQNFELARLLDAYTDYVQSMETAWQVMPLEKQTDPTEKPRIRNASAIAIFGVSAFVADSVLHIILKVNMLNDEVQMFCGMRGKAGFHDGPREIAKFNTPSGMAYCEGNSTLYVCDTGNHAIRAIGIPSGIVMTISLSSVDNDGAHFESPFGITIVRGDYEYEEGGSEDEDEDGDDDGDRSNPDSSFLDGSEDDDEEGVPGHKMQLLEGISEEDEVDTESYKAFSNAGAWDEGHQMARGSKNPGARYALAATNEPPTSKVLGHAVGRLNMGRRRLSSIHSDGGHLSRRPSSYLSASISRRTSGFLSTLSSRRVSSSVTPGESVKDSLRECTEEDEEVGYNLAVTGDHCIYLVRPDKNEFLVLAGSPSEYGYKDAEKGHDARFSSLKGIVAIRNSLFVADHWNNVIRCVNLKTRQVDTVIDFNPCGPIALTVSSSGSVYVLDAEHVSVCNILQICSLHCSNGDTEEVLGTTMFRMIQDSIGRSRQSSMDIDPMILDGMSRRGSYRKDASSRRASGDSDMASDFGASRRGSFKAEEPGNRRRSSTRSTGAIDNLGPRDNKLQLPGGPMGGDNSRRGSFVGGGGDMSRRGSAVGGRSERRNSRLPQVPTALRSLVPGASLHPALVQMTLRTQDSVRNSVAQRNSVSAFTGSQFRVSVVSSVPDDEFEDAPEFVSFLNPKLSSPWKQIPIGTLQYVYQQATGQCSANTPLALAYWDAADTEVAAAAGLRNPQQLLVGSQEMPSIVKVMPPRKGAPEDNGRFRAVAVDVDRVVMADTDSHRIFVVNHTKLSKHKIAGCGKAGYLDGPLDVCRMNHPSSIALDPTTHYIYVADSGNHRIRCIDLSTGFMSTVCGNGVKGNRDGNELRVQSLDSPFDVHFMHPCHLLISCADNSIRRLDLNSKQLETILIGS